MEEVGAASIDRPHFCSVSMCKGKWDAGFPPRIASRRDDARKNLGRREGFYLKDIKLFAHISRDTARGTDVSYASSSS